ncbi:MAG TPA: HEAT repeat domain-containing protein, partial [Candidatus Angelobacter sp.]|nr:HEAT repeat domain-containing protein [Candidatus Angelobacter sp.]
MKSRKKRLVLTGATALILGAVVFVQVRRASREARTRAEVYYWIRSFDSWDRNQTETANQHRQLEGLRSVGAGAVTTLERDLHYRPALSRLSEKIPFLQRFLPQPGPTDEPQEVRHRAAYFLGALGPAAKAAVPELLPLLSDSDGRVRFETAFALGRIGADTPEVRTALTKMLMDPVKEVRFSAAISLWSFDRTNTTATSRVEQLISTNNLSWPSISLMKFGENARVFAPDLKRAINGTPWSYSRIQAVHAL